MQPWLRATLAVAGFGGAGVAGFFALRAAGIVGELPRAEGESFLVNTLTLTSTKQDFVRSVMEAVKRVEPTAGRQMQQLMAAWAAHESGWAKTRQAKLGFNLWNVSKGSWTGPVLDGGDTEYVAGQSSAKRITQQWRQYATLDAAVNDLLALLRNSRYVNYREAYTKLQQGDPTFATSLGVMEKDGSGSVYRIDNRANTAGFYTLPRSQYQAATNALYRDVQTLSGVLAGLAKV